MMLETSLKTSLLHLTLKEQNHKETSDNSFIAIFHLIRTQIIQLHVCLSKPDSYFLFECHFLKGYKFTENTTLVNQCLSQHGSNS